MARFVPPPHACDAHVHVFGPAAVFPLAPDRPYTPEDRPKAALFALHDRLGITRCCIVQAGAHGFDNTAVADALAARPGAYRGVALLPPDTGDATLQTMHTQGFRGVRFHYMAHLGKAWPIDAVLAFAARLAPLGWHLQIHTEPGRIAELAPALRRSPVPVVIDHMGRVGASATEQPPLTALRRLLEHDHVWVKLSGADRASIQGPPYADAVPMARTLAQDAPNRILWGSDWPHPNHVGPMPDEQAMLDMVPLIAPSQAARQAMLVDNPHRLYGFTA